MDDLVVMSPDTDCADRDPPDSVGEEQTEAIKQILEGVAIRTLRSQFIFDCMHGQLDVLVSDGKEVQNELIKYIVAR